MRTRVLFLLLAALLLAAPSFAAGGCDLPPGLFQHRADLEKKEAHLSHWPAGTAPAPGQEGERRSLAASREAIDRQYFAFMDWLAETAARDATTARRCCARVRKDLLARDLCALSLYLVDRSGGRRDFVAPFSKEDPELRHFFLMDYLEAASPEPSGRSRGPTLFGDRSPMDVYLDELVRLMSTGDPLATAKYFAILEQSDGYVAEEMDEQVINFFDDHPKLVVRNWRFIRPAADRIGFYFSTPEQARRVIARIRETCGHSPVCLEILRTLESGDFG